MLQAGIRCSSKTSRRGLIQTRSLLADWISVRTHTSEAGQLKSCPTPTFTPRTRKDGDPSTYWRGPPLPKPTFPKRTICIKGWTSFGDTVEVLAVLQTVEQKFGPILDYVVVKDFEMPDKPFGIIFAAFANSESFRLVPAQGIELAVPAPSYKARPGGPGWKDIERLLVPGKRDPDFDRKHDFTISNKSGNERQHIFVRVSPSKKELVSPPPPPDKTPSPEMRRQIAERFVRWGQAQPLSPMASDTPILDTDLFGETENKEIRVHAALRWAAKASQRKIRSRPHVAEEADNEHGSSSSP